MKVTLLKFIRSSLSGKGSLVRQIGAGLILLMIVVVFVFFGYSAKDSLGVGTVAEVNGVTLSAADFQREYQRIEELYRQVFRSMPLGGAKEQRDFLRSQTLNNLIDAELLYQLASREGLRVPSSEIARIITIDFEPFQEKGRFKRERYEALLQANQWSVGDFEHQIRKDRTIRAFQQWVTLGLGPGKMDLKMDQKLSEKKKIFEYVPLTLSQWVKNAKPFGPLLAEFLKKENLETELLEEFHRRSQEFDKPEEVRARHILIAKNHEGRSEEQTQEKIKALQKELNNKNFGDIAKKFSDDSSSKEKGGDLGFFRRGQMVKDFEDAAFKAPLGQIIGPVETEFGYHWIQVLEKKPEEKADFSKLKKTLTNELFLKSVYERELEKLKDFLQNGRKDEITKWLREWGLSWQISDPVDLNSMVLNWAGSIIEVDKVWKIHEHSPYPNDLLRSADAVFLVRLKKVTNSNQSSENPTLQARATELIMRLLNDFKKNSKVSQNPLAFK